MRAKTVVSLGAGVIASLIAFAPPAATDANRQGRRPETHAVEQRRVARTQPRVEAHPGDPRIAAHKELE